MRLETFTQALHYTGSGAQEDADLSWVYTQRAWFEAHWAVFYGAAAVVWEDAWRQQRPLSQTMLALICGSFVFLFCFLMIPQISWHTLFWSMAQKPNFVLSIKSCFVMFSAVFCSEQGCPIALSHPFHNLHNGSWLCPHCFARKDIRILWDGNLRIRDLPIPWAQIAARAPSFLKVSLLLPLATKLFGRLRHYLPAKGKID